jgi:hypothetical protein
MKLTENEFKKFTELLKGVEVDRIRFKRSESSKSIFARRKIGYFGFETKLNHLDMWAYNECSNVISVLHNHCLSDSSLDLQYEDIFISPDESKIELMIYCKKSNSTKWQFMDFGVLY